MKNCCTFEEASRQVILREVSDECLLSEDALFHRWLDSMSWASRQYELIDEVPLDESTGRYDLIVEDLVATGRIKRLTITTTDQSVKFFAPSAAEFSFG